MAIIKISGNEKRQAELNAKARHVLLNILERKGIEIPELEEAIETAYEYYYNTRPAHLEPLEEAMEEEYEKGIKNGTYSPQYRHWSAI